jgi:hypothetical protein
MTPQTATPDPSANPNPNSWMQTYGQLATPDPEGPKINVLCKKTLTFVEALGTKARHMQVENKPGIQSVEAWIQNTETWKMGTQDGSIILVTGRSTRTEALEPPTVAQVMAARACSAEEAQVIVDLETVKFNQGEYPYPAKTAAPVPAGPAVVSYPEPPTLEQVMAAGYKKPAADKIVATELKKAAAGVFPYGPTADPKYWGGDLDATDAAAAAQANAESQQ